MWLIELVFSSILQIWYVDVRISRHILESPLEFEITRVDCIFIIMTKRSFILGYVEHEKFYNLMARLI